MTRVTCWRLIFVGMGIAGLGSTAGCSRQPGTLVVTGTGLDDYYVADRAGQKALTGNRRTNAATELPAGAYTIVLNGSRQSVSIKGGKKTEVPAGNLVVTGTGLDDYYVADANGQSALTGHRRTNFVTELLPGSYTVVLNGSHQSVTITGGQKMEVQAGSLVVTGTGLDDYYVADAAGQTALTGHRKTSFVTELLNGSYTVVLNGSRQSVTIAGAQKAEVQAGDLIVSGTGVDDYYVADANGQTALTGHRRTNFATELLPGTYTVVLNGSRQSVTMPGGQKTEVRAGNLLVSGSGADDYYVADANGQTALTGHRRINTATELLAGTYVVRSKDSKLTVQVRAGRTTTAKP